MIDKEIINKYIQGELPISEQTKVIKEIRDNDELLHLFTKLKAKHTALLIKTKESNIDVRKEYDLLKTRLKKKSIKRYLRVASIIVLMLSTGLGYYFNSNSLKIQTVFSNSNYNKEVILSDGSKVLLNSHSKITFSDFQQSKNRIVSLEGEAYFNVIKDSQKPFIVRTDNLDITVLGTTFNVKSYKKDNFVTTTLLTGKVQVLKNNTIISNLKPNQRLVYNTLNETYSVDIVADTNDTVSWKKGQIIFDATPLNQVTKELERLYNVNISLDVKNQSQYKFTAQFKNTTGLTEILDLLKITSSINYSISGNNIKISN